MDFSQVGDGLEAEVGSSVKNTPTAGGLGEPVGISVPSIDRSSYPEDSPLSDSEGDGDSVSA